MSPSIDKLNPQGEDTQVKGCCSRNSEADESCVCKAGSLPANVSKYVLICSNGPHDRSGWFGLISDMMDQFDNQPTFVVHSKRKIKCWPGPLVSSIILVDLRLYIFAGGQRQTLLAPDYHPLPFMSDDNDDDEEEFKTPVKAEGSISTSSCKTFPPLTTKLLLSLDGLMTPKQKNLDDYHRNIYLQQPHPNNTLDDLSTTPKRKHIPAPFPFMWTPKKETDTPSNPMSDDNGFFGDVLEVSLSSKTIKQLKKHSEGFTKCHQSRCSHTKGKWVASQDVKACYLNGEGIMTEDFMAINAKCFGCGLFYFSKHCGSGHTCPPPIVIED
ncbi:hypothetical protein ARMGADRAFT_1037021 [Armillaria gallica]|uniref:Uncharacterized protein n=1 Tax=Armillaria gallica TaxID=47427 RepID=A0A2H3D884_ARMGA|nr:hypothetical protein ARMGADRAFT_1037021 [Armillaria gallica]